MIHILNVEPLNYSAEARQILRSIGRLDERSLTRAELLDCLIAYDVLIVRLGFQVDCEVIDAGQRLKVIVTATTGLDHIDEEYAKQRGITVLSLRGETEFLRTIPATAEHTWALLLTLVRRIPWAFQSVQAGYWDRDAFRGYELCGKRLGIVGLGRIGEKVARYGLAFGMSVSVFDSYRPEWPNDIKRCETLEELLCLTEVLSLHVSLNRETIGMIGRQELLLLPTGAILINTSRGAVIDEQALYDVLMSGHLGGAALDVLTHERATPGDTGRALLEYAKSHHNLIITPHIGGATFESMARTEVFMARKLCDYFRVLLSGDRV